jgi:hypothetical protein
MYETSVNSPLINSVTNEISYHFRKEIYFGETPLPFCLTIGSFVWVHPLISE